MKLIRVSGCHDCPWTDGKYCREIKNGVMRFVRTKTLPDNCPLENDNVKVKSKLPTLEERVRKIEIETQPYGSAK